MKIFQSTQTQKVAKGTSKVKVMNPPNKWVPLTIGMKYELYGVTNQHFIIRDDLGNVTGYPKSYFESPKDIINNGVYDVRSQDKMPDRIMIVGRNPVTNEYIIQLESTKGIMTLSDTDIRKILSNKRDAKVYQVEDVKMMYTNGHRFYVNVKLDTESEMRDYINTLQEKYPKIDMVSITEAFYPNGSRDYSKKGVWIKYKNPFPGIFRGKESLNH